MPKHRNTSSEIEQTDSLIQNENNNIIANQPNNELPSVSPLEALPLEIIAEIAAYMPNNDIINDDAGNEIRTGINARTAFAATCPLFYNEYARVQQPRTLKQLLLCTAHGKEDQIKKLFDISPALIRYLIEKSDVEDYSGRQFKNISAFQYALWARDWHMWEMMLLALDAAEALAVDENAEGKINVITKTEIAKIRATLWQQYHEVVDKDKGLDYTITRMNENNEPMTLQIKGETHFDLEGPEFCLMPQEANFVPEKGKIYVKIEQGSLHYTLISLSGEPVTASIFLEHLAPLTQLSTNEDIKPFITPILKMTAMRGHTHPQALIRGLKTYCEQFDNWDWDQRKNHWCLVGMAQCEVPANIAQEYCRTDLVLSKKRSFKELEFSRTLKVNNWINGKVESWFPLHLDNKLGNDFSTSVGRGGELAGETPRILAALLALCEVRSEQVIELGGRLSEQVQQEIDLEIVKDSCMSSS